MAIVFVGVDLAKNVFALHGVDEHGKPVLVGPSVARAGLLQVVAALPPCIIGMEACSGAHYWARQFARLRHSVRLMAPKLVSPWTRAGRARSCRGDATTAISPNEWSSGARLGEALAVRRERRHKGAALGVSARWRGYASQPPANPPLVRSVLWTKQ